MTAKTETPTRDELLAERAKVRTAISDLEGSVDRLGVQIDELCEVAQLIKSVVY